MSNDATRATIRLATRGKSDTVFLPQDARDHGPLRKLLGKSPQLFSFDEAKGVYTLLDRDDAVATVASAEPMSVTQSNPRSAESDDEDWIPVKKQTASGLMHGVVVSIAEKENAKVGRASICFRGAAKSFLGEGAVSIDIDVGGDNLNRLRIRAYRNSNGEFKLARPGRANSGTPRAMFAIDLWPNQTRSAPASFEVKHEASCDFNYLIVTLPKDWAKPLAEIKVAPKTNSAGLPASAPATKIGQSESYPRPAPPAARAAPSVNMGEPPPGRSALDQRNAQRRV